MGLSNYCLWFTSFLRKLQINVKFFKIRTKSRTVLNPHANLLTFEVVKFVPKPLNMLLDIFLHQFLFSTFGMRFLNIVGNHQKHCYVMYLLFNIYNNIFCDFVKVQLCLKELSNSLYWLSLKSNSINYQFKIDQHNLLFKTNQKFNSFLKKKTK